MVTRPFFWLAGIRRLRITGKGSRMMMTSWPMFKAAFVNQMMYWFIQRPPSWFLFQKEVTG
jgi:hypothetical protein